MKYHGNQITQPRHHTPHDVILTCAGTASGNAVAEAVTRSAILSGYKFDKHFTGYVEGLARGKTPTTLPVFTYVLNLRP